MTPPPSRAVQPSPELGGGGEGGQFDFNFIAERLIHGSLSPAVTPVMTFHHDEKWSDIAHYSSRSLWQGGAGGPRTPMDSERWSPLITTTTLCPQHSSPPPRQMGGGKQSFAPATIGLHRTGGGRTPPSTFGAVIYTHGRHPLTTPPPALYCPPPPFWGGVSGGGGR